MQFLEFVSLAPYTTFGIGGPARWFTEAASEEDVTAAFAFAGKRGVAVFVLGGGSNLLVSDHGFGGLVLRVRVRGIRQEGDVFHVAAGENWDEFVRHAVSRGYGGVECLAGIPGTVGATPVQNVGAYGQEVAETIVSVRAYDTVVEQFVTLTATECGFAYRHSIFNTEQRGRYVVTEVAYALRPQAAPHLAYAELQRRFPAGAQPSLMEVCEAVREIRHGKGMLIVPGEPDCRSAGSFFKNPVIDRALYERIAAKSETPVPSYPAGEGQVKLPAAWLVERAGFPKGFGNGPAGISSRHTLALVNRGEAKASDVLVLATQILQGVYKKFGVTLEMEPVVVA
jgi:UDP-N-acetylmuramate dehydrogenase